MATNNTDRSNAYKTDRPNTDKEAKKKHYPVREDPRRGNDRVSASSAKLSFTVDDRPTLAKLNLPGPRRELEGRGGATTPLTGLRSLIRCPLLPALATAIAPRTGGRPAAYPDIFWLFVLAANREFASNDKLLQFLKDHWTDIAKEFYFEHGVELPRQPGIAYASFNSWRTYAFIDRTHQLDIILSMFTTVSAPLALAVRAAEGGDRPRDLLHPAVWDCIAADGTVRDAPSNVIAVPELQDTGEWGVRYDGSRAHVEHPARARVHEPMPEINKPHGAKKGLYNVVATTRGEASYSRTVLGMEIGQPREGEAPIAMRLLHRIYGHLGHELPTLVYDGAMMPIHWQDLMAQYGVFCVNANYARVASKVGRGRGESRNKDFDPDSTTTGEGSYKNGTKRGKKKATYVTQLDQQRCHNGHDGDNGWHVHFIAADDGSVYETDKAVLTGGMSAKRIQALVPVHAERVQGKNGRYFFRLQFRGECHKAGGQFTFTHDVEWTAPDNDGRIGWRTEIANVRLIPEIAEIYPEVNGNRNQIEGFFSWMEQCFYRHDRAASWGHEAQVLDLIATGLLHNSETWAHLAYRNPEQATQLADQLQALPAPDLRKVRKKPLEGRKKAVTTLLLNPMTPETEVEIAVPVAVDDHRGHAKSA